MTKLFLSLIAMVVTLGACSTISKKQSYSYPLPPDSAMDVWGRDPVQADQALERTYLNDPKNEPLKLLVRYQQAKLWQTKDAAKSCALWAEVLREPRFPLSKIARLHAMEICSGPMPSIDDVMATTTEPWLTAMTVRSSLTRAQHTKNKAWEMKLSFQVTELEKLQSEKIKLLQRAKVLALELNDGESAALAQTRIETMAPRFVLNPPRDQWMHVANDFKQAREFANARKLYQQIVNSPDFNAFEKIKALDGIRMSFKLEKNTEAYITGSRAYSDFAKDHFLKFGLKLCRENNAEAKPMLSKYFETRQTLARAIWTEGNPAEAEKILLNAERDVKGCIPTYDSVLTRSRIEEEAGRFNKTVELLSSIDTEHVTSRETRSKILWYKAWNMRKAGRLKESAQSLLALIPAEESQTASARDRFWYAKTLKDLGRVEESQDQLQRVIDYDSLGWYGLLAYRELGEQIPSLAASVARGPASVITRESAFLPEEKLQFEWLLSAGELEIAKLYLDNTIATRRLSFSAGQSLDLLQSYARAGSFQALFSKLYELPAETRKDLLSSNPELMFPQPWTGLVKTASTKFDVQTELIYSIMRQESSFNPMARSPADAFGLMQLIPEMAKKAEDSAGIKMDSHEDLYEPETNIPLGAAFIRGLLTQWKGGFIPTVASYNASEKAIAGWVKSRYKGDTLAFIEDVPYDETRNYIKLVMRNFIFYKRLNSGGANVPFPEWCLANLQDVKL